MNGSLGAQKIDKELNLKGKVYPYTFINSMLALEEMKIGEVLRVIVDYPPAVSDVLKSLKKRAMKSWMSVPFKEYIKEFFIYEKDIFRPCGHNANEV